MHQASFSRRGSLLAAASVLGLTVAAPAAAEIPGGQQPIAKEDIVANHLVDPLGPGSLATGAAYANSPDVLEAAGTVNGIGQQISFTQTGPASGGLGLCSGTLINPRTVITAAHCVYNVPAYRYGSNTGVAGAGSVNGPFGAITSIGATTISRAVITSQGIPLSFGFGSTNRCLGVTAGVNAALSAVNTAGNGCQGETGAYEVWRNSGFQTNVALNIYNANQVWYGTGSQPIALGGLGEFANQDIAIVTLDTHANGIPTWALLFSPLDGPTHATVTGYGGAGVGLSGIGSLAGIDYRRRSAENMIDGLFSTRDWVSSPAISGPGSTQFLTHQHSIYFLDFDDPTWSAAAAAANPRFFSNNAGAGNRNNGYYDFNGLGGTALPNEGATAGGDSGGPLIVDQRWDRQVVAGVLTGSLSFNGGLSTYGQFNVYPPLFHFWEEIVRNNPYKYASALAGNGDWFDPTHWVQDMDPNYVTIGADGELVNLLPDIAQGGADGPVAKFGTVCFLEVRCSTMTGPGQPAGDGIPHYTLGGPGTTNFVPNNVEPVNSATAASNVKARYYDVTLRETGTTTLSAAATIDKMTINGPSKLSIAATGTLNTWADYTQIMGWTNVDGVLNTHEMLVVEGLLTGSGTINSDFLTVAAAIVAPGGGDSIGTLTVNSDMILASASSYFVDVTRNSSDLLDVAGVLALNGGAVVFNKVTDAPAPRHGTSRIIAHADLGVDGVFGSVYTFQGVLRPFLTYTENDVRAEFRAGSLVEILDGGSATEIAFASALDALRLGSYNSLWNLYGSIDLMNATQLSATLSGLTPRVIGEVGALHDHQSRLLTTSVTDRLSLLGSGRAKGMSFVGQLLAAFAARAGQAQTVKLGFGASNGGGASVADLPGKLTGFVSGGIERTRSTYGDRGYKAGNGGWHMAMGLETPLGENGTLGTAVGMAEGASSPAGDNNRSRTTMAAAYAATPLGDGFYVGGMLSAETSRASVERLSTDGSAIMRLSGATSAARYSALAEAGLVTGIAKGLTLTPRVQLGYGRYTLKGFSETGGETALKLNDLTMSRVEARVGAKLEGAIGFAGGTIKPQISADYVNLLAGRETGVTVRFAAAPDVGFALPLSVSKSGWVEAKGGVTFDKGPFSFGLSGQHAVGGGAMSDQRAQADFRFRF